MMKPYYISDRAIASMTAQTDAVGTSIAGISGYNIDFTTVLEIFRRHSRLSEAPIIFGYAQTHPRKANTHKGVNAMRLPASLIAVGRRHCTIEKEEEV